MLKDCPRVIIACDFHTQEQLDNFLSLFPNQKLFLKLGLEIIYSLGFKIIGMLKKMGHAIFLDLKLHDIPNTTVQALKVIKNYQVEFTSIHISGGISMLKQSQAIVANSNTELLGITLLTSIDENDLKDLPFKTGVVQSVETLMKIASQANIKGVVSSAYETSIAKKHNLISVVPGISFKQKQYDQKRSLTFLEVKKYQPDFIVVGRAITQSKNPYQTYQKILKEITI